MQNAVKFSICLGVLLLGSLMLSAGAFTPWSGTLCSALYTGGSSLGGSCLGNITTVGTVTLTSDLNISGNLTLGGTLNLNGFAIAGGHVLNYQGYVINTGYGSTPTGDNPGVSFPNSFGGSGGASQSDDNAHNFCGGYTLYSIGCATGGTPSAPSMTNILINNWILNGIQNFLEAAGGAGSQEQNRYPTPGQPPYGAYIQFKAILGSGGIINAFGQQGQFVSSCNGGPCDSATAGSSGGATIVLVSQYIQDGTYNINGGAANGGCVLGGSCSNSYAGGNGQVVKYTYSTQPVPTPFIPPQVSNVLPNNVLEQSSVAFTVNIIQTTNPLKNYTIFWGDGNSNLVTNSLTSNVIHHTYNYVAPATSFNVIVYACDINGECNDSFTQAIKAYYTPAMGNTLTANSIPTNSVLEGRSYFYTINDIQGSYAIKNTTVNWGDGTKNVITSSSASVNAIHAYAYVSGTTKPDIFSASIVVCDVNNVCTTTPKTIYGQYTSAQINKVTPSATTYSTLSNAFTFNIIKGNYSVSTLQVVWGDGSSPSFISINSLTPTVSHVYSIAGNYVIQATAIDSNSAPSLTFSYNVMVSPYVSPKISALTPTTVYSANNIVYSFMVTKGTFNLATNSVSINWGNGNTLVKNAINGVDTITFNYPNNGNYSAFETVTDINGYTGLNTTLIGVSPYPWNFTTPTPIINYNVTNKTTSIYVQTNQTDNLAVNYSVQKQNIANDYICSASISNSGLFSISCVTNPNVFSYTNQTLYVAIYATDTHGSIKQLLERINLYPKSPPPTPPITPFSSNTVKKPLPSPSFVPLNALFITIILSAGIILAVLAAYISRSRRRK